MNPMLRILAIVLTFAGKAWAEPVNCVVDGKTIYTDDTSLCVKGRIEAINNRVSVFPEVKTPTSGPVVGNLPSNSLTDAILRPFGLIPQDIVTGWQTIMDAKKRGSWQEPEMPDDAK